jgi:hypothetical protein
VARTVEVDSRAIMDALRNIYHADSLVNEITSGQGAPLKPNPQMRNHKPVNRQQ